MSDAANPAAAAAPPGIAWDWSAAALSAVYALPAAFVMYFGVSKGLSWGFGVLPGAVLGLAPRRRARVRTVVLGSLMGIPIFVGSALADLPWLAVLSVIVLAIGAAALASRVAIGVIVMHLALPMIGVGLSYDTSSGFGLALLIVGGSVYAWLVSLLWPEQPTPSVAAAPLPPLRPMLAYGVRLGLAGATAATIGFALGLDHVGWATAAALLVMRPSADMQKLRSLDRVIDVVIGGLAAAALAWCTTASWPYSIAVVVVLMGVGATAKSRWYITPLFTTFLALSLLVYANPATAGSRFNERLFETALGVGLAYFFGLLVPRVAARR